MRHQQKRNKLSRSSSHRKALLMNLCKEVIEHERIKTTAAKAKAVKPELEQLITLGKRGDLHARRQALSTLDEWRTTIAPLSTPAQPRSMRPGDDPGQVRRARGRPSRWSRCAAGPA